MPCRFLLRGYLMVGIVLFSVSTGLAERPSAQGVLDEAESLRARYESEIGSPGEDVLVSLAVAHAWLGESERAMAIASDVEGLFGGAGITLCAEVSLRTTGRLIDVTRGAFRSPILGDAEWLTYRQSIAGLLYELGRSEEAIKLLPDDDATVPTTKLLGRFYRRAALNDLDTGKPVTARNRCLKAMALMQRHPRRRDVDDGQNCLSIVQILLKLKEHDAAVQCLNELLQRLQNALNPELLEQFNGTSKPDFLLAVAWAHLGKINALLGQKAESGLEFQRALSLLDQALAAEGGSVDLALLEYSRGLNQIGQWQYEAGDPDLGRQTIRKAVSAGVRNKSFRLLVLSESIDAFSTVNDVAAAREVLPLIDSQYWTVKAHCEIAKAEARTGDSQAAKNSLGEAARLAGSDDSDTAQSGLWIKLAETWSALEDEQQTRKALARALDASDRIEGRASHRQIVLTQIQLGQFEEARRTASLIPDLRARLRSIARLAQELAETEVCHEE